MGSVIFFTLGLRVRANVKNPGPENPALIAPRRGGGYLQTSKTFVNGIAVVIRPGPKDPVFDYNKSQTSVFYNLYN